MNKLDEFFKAIERDRESLGTIMKKHRGLAEILDSAPGSEYED